MPKSYSKATIEKANGKMIAIASDETVDRHGESLPIDSWDLKNFKNNPVLIWAHDYSIPPIGLAKNMRIEGRKLIFEPEFHGITQLAREVKAMFESDPPIMNSFSVGFIPHYENETANGSIPLELLEVSAVPVPANPSARVMVEKAVGAPMTDAEKTELAAWLKTFAPPETKEPDSSAATSMEVQTIICAKSEFDTEEKAHAWVLDHGFKADKVDETDDSFRYRQFEPDMCQKDSYRAIDLDAGVKAGICRTTKAIDNETIAISEKYLQRLSSEIVALNEKLKSSAP